MPIAKVLTLTALPLLLLAAAAPAQTGDFNHPHDPYVAAIGLAAGLTSGTGLAVRWPGLPQTMVGVAGGAWGDRDDLAWNIGFEAHYVLRQSGNLRVYAGPSLAFYSDDDDEQTDTNVSVGIGVEYLMYERVAWKADVGFSYLGEDGDVYPLPQLGVFFYF